MDGCGLGYAHPGPHPYESITNITPKKGRKKGRIIFDR
jgi:hypothetical protein